MKNMMYLFLALALCAMLFAGCTTSSVEETEPVQEQTVAWEDMERVEVFLPDLEEEFKTDWKAFYEQYKDVVLVVSDGEVEGNHLESISSQYLRVSQGGGGRHASARFLFDESDKTDEVLNLPMQETVTLEGVLQPPTEDNIKYNSKPLYIFIEHCKLIEHSPWENPLYLSFDITPAFEETKAELLEKYSFVTSIEFSVVRSGKDGEFLSGDEIYFETEVAAGTDPKETLEYADYAARLLNANAKKLDPTIASSTAASYGGLYKKHYMLIRAYKEGTKEAWKDYYIHHVVSAREGNKIQLQKAYR